MIFMKLILKAFVFLIFCTSALSQITSNTNIAITKSWSQEPTGWTYPMAIHVPNINMPSNGFPVTILLHGNGGNGNGMLNQWVNNISCHVLVSPTGYLNSWNISNEQSNAPDVEMITELVNTLQVYSNVNPNKINIIGSSNGAALANRVFIENKNTGIATICSIVSQINQDQYRNNTFYYPSANTGPALSNNGYDTSTVPLTGRKYLSICNTNDPVIPYDGGNAVGVNFYPAEEAIYIMAKSQGNTSQQITGSGDALGDNVNAFSYLNNQVVLLNGTSQHGLNGTQKNYLLDFIDSDCSQLSAIDHLNPSFLCYPNPTEGEIYVTPTNCNIEVYNLFGQLIATSSNGITDLSYFPAASYIIKTSSKNTSESKTQLVIKK